MKLESEGKDTFTHMIAHAKTLVQKIQEFVCDNNGEFDNEHVGQILSKNGGTLNFRT